MSIKKKSKKYNESLKKFFSGLKQTQFKSACLIANELSLNGKVNTFKTGFSESQISKLSKQCCNKPPYRKLRRYFSKLKLSINEKQYYRNWRKNISRVSDINLDPDYYGCTNCLYLAPKETFLKKGFLVDEGRAVVCGNCLFDKVVMCSHGVPVTAKLLRILSQ